MAIDMYGRSKEPARFTLVVHCLICPVLGVAALSKNEGI